MSIYPVVSPAGQGQDRSASPSSPPPLEDDLDLAALGLDAAEVAAQRAMLDGFERISISAPATAAVSQTRARIEAAELTPGRGGVDFGDLLSPYETAMQRKVLEAYEKGSSADPIVLEDDELDLASFGMNAGEIAAQKAMLEAFERRSSEQKQYQPWQYQDIIFEPPAVTPPRTGATGSGGGSSLGATGRTPEQLMSALGLVSPDSRGEVFKKFKQDQEDMYKRFDPASAPEGSTRGVLARPGLDRAMNRPRSKVLADSVLCCYL